MTEQDIERLAATLGQAPAEAVDPDQIAAKVVARLGFPARRRAVRWLVGLAAAAALMLLAGRFLLGPGSRPIERAAEQPSVLQELDPLSVDQLEELLRSMPVTASTLPLETIPLQELDSTNLERLLRSLEG